MTFGLTPTGFNPKRFEDVVTSLQTRAKATFGEDINVSPDSVMGQIISTAALEIANVWELGAAINASYNPLTAEGQQLDDRAAEVGIIRLPAASTRVNVEFLGDLSTVIPLSMVVSNELTKDQYQVTESATISQSSCSEATIEVTTVTNAGVYTVTINGNAITYTADGDATALEIAAGLKAAFDLETAMSGLATCVDNLDGTVTVTLDSSFISGDVRLSFVVTSNLTITEAGVILPVDGLLTGPITAPVNKITVIETTLSGVNSVRNRIAGVLGRNIETDSELRIRRVITLKQSSAATKDAILSEILGVDGVTAAFLIENTTSVPDGEGRPGKSFQLIVQGGDDQEIADALWSVKPAGIETTNLGLQAGTPVVDSAGDTQTVYFSRPDTKRIWVNITYTLFDEEVFPSGGAVTLAEKAAEYGNSIGIGKDIIPKRFYGTLYSSVPGIEDVTVEVSDDGVTFTDLKLVVAAFELPDFDIADISVTAV